MAAERRVAIVAGGSGGIGGATAQRLAAAGATVYVGHRRGEERARAICRAIADEGGVAHAIPLDLTDRAAVDEQCRLVYEKEGRLDIAVNCAAINREAPALGLEDAAWREVLDTNLDGAFRFSRAAAPWMMLGRWGRIVQVSSVAASHGGRGQINYAASKAGLEAMVRVLALELGRKGVLVNCVAPGVVETDLSERVRAEHGAALIERIAVRRFGVPGDVAAVIAFLASDDAAYINGQTIRVDGGFDL